MGLGLGERLGGGRGRRRVDGLDLVQLHLQLPGEGLGVRLGLCVLGRLGARLLLIALQPRHLVDTGEMQARCRRDAGGMQAGCRRDAGGCRGDVARSGSRATCASSSATRAAAASASAAAAARCACASPSCALTRAAW